MLQSVGFLYVTALGDGTAASPIKLSGDELAANLAFLVAGAPTAAHAAAKRKAKAAAKRKKPVASERLVEIVLRPR